MPEIKAALEFRQEAQMLISVLVSTINQILLEFSRIDYSNAYPCPTPPLKLTLSVFNVWNSVAIYTLDPGLKRSLPPRWKPHRSRNNEADSF